MAIFRVASIRFEREGLQTANTLLRPKIALKLETDKFNDTNVPTQTEGILARNNHQLICIVLHADLYTCVSVCVCESGRAYA